MWLAFVFLERFTVAVDLVEQARQRGVGYAVCGVDEGAGLMLDDLGDELGNGDVEGVGGGLVVEVESDDECEHVPTVTQSGW